MNDSQLSDETLESWFTAAAAEYEVPAGAFDRVLAAAGEKGKPRQPRFQHPRLVAAAVLLIAAAGGATVWNGVGHRSGAAETALRKAVSHGPGSSSSAGGAAAPAAPATVERFAAAGPTTASGDSAQGGGGVATGTKGAAKTLQRAAAGVGGEAADGAKIVHTGTLGLTVAKGQVSSVLNRLTGLAAGLGGYVASSTTAEDGPRPSGSIILRVPAGSFDTALAQARSFGTPTSNSSVAADVTATYVDLQAHINSLKKARDHYLTLEAKATTIGETLSVQQRVDDAQTQIDSLQGQLNLLGDQASMGTLTVTVGQKLPAVVPPKPVHHQSGLSKAWHRAVDGFVTGVEALLARSGRGLVVLIVLAVGLVVLRAAWKVGRRRLV